MAFIVPLAVVPRPRSPRRGSLLVAHGAAAALPPSSLPHPQAVRKLMDAKKLESTLAYDSTFGDGGKQ